jgi:hypothetical protein
MCRKMLLTLSWHVVPGWFVGRWLVQGPRARVLDISNAFTILPIVTVALYVHYIHTQVHYFHAHFLQERGSQPCLSQPMNRRLSWAVSVSAQPPLKHFGFRHPVQALMQASGFWAGAGPSSCVLSWGGVPPHCLLLSLSHTPCVLHCAGVMGPTATAGRTLA